MTDKKFAAGGGPAAGSGAPGGACLCFQFTTVPALCQAPETARLRQAESSLLVREVAR